MFIARFISRIGFALGALAIVAGFGFTLEYQPLISALAQ
jgi:hypothetical protein